MKRFKQTVLAECFRGAFRNKFFKSVEALQGDLGEWLYYSNHERIRTADLLI